MFFEKGLRSTLNDVNGSFYFSPAGSSRYPYQENSSSDSEEEILRRLKLQHSISLQSGQTSKYGGFSQSINLDGFQPVPTSDVGMSSSKPIKYSSSRNSILYNNGGHRYIGNNNNRDLLGQAERGKIGSHTSSECSSNSSVEASVESNTGLLNHEKKGSLRVLCCQGCSFQCLSPWRFRSKTNKSHLGACDAASGLENRAEEQRE